MKNLHSFTFAQTGLTLLGLAATVAFSGAAHAQTDKMGSDKMSGGTAMTAKTGAALVGTGSFRQITHATKGTATLASESGKTVVKLSNFETGMGPKLHVYLVPGAITSNAQVKTLVAAHKIVDLGALKSIKGSQNYIVPSGSKLGKGASVVVWCEKFDVVFGAATLS